MPGLKKSEIAGWTLALSRRPPSLFITLAMHYVISSWGQYLFTATQVVQPD